MTQQRKRVLIVRSSPLNSGVVPFTSSLELIQAKLLRQCYDVAILSVSQSDVPVGTGARTLVRQLVSTPNKEDLKAFGRVVAGLAVHLCSVRDVDIHHVDGVAVYEGEGSHSVFERSFEAKLGAWVSGAFAAFRRYCAAFGMPDLVHAHGRFFNAGAFALAAKKSAGIPYVYTEHSSFYHRGVAPAASRPILKEIVEGAAVFSVVSPFLGNSVECFLGNSIARPIVIPNVVDPIFEEADLTSPPNKNPFVFIGVTAFYEHKGVDLLLRAFAEAFGSDRAYVLKLCGDGPLCEDLERLARELGLSGEVEFLGRVPQAEVLRRIDGAHVLVVSSLVETFSFAVIEGLARGRPVIATRCGGPNSLVDDESGVLVEPNNIGQLAAAMKGVARDFEAYDPREIRQRALRRFGANAFRNHMDVAYRTALMTAAVAC